MSQANDNTIDIRDPASETPEDFQVVDPSQNGAEETQRSPERRISQLELALEQCQIYIDELKATLSDQEFLEAQLASTEEYSHIQQKAIAALRDQILQRQSHEKDMEILRDQREALSSQVDHQLQTLADLQTRFENAEREISRLQSANQRLEAELQLALDTDVESTQQRIIAQQTNERLRVEIRSLEERLQILGDRFKKGEDSQTRYRAIINALQNAQKSDSQKNLAIRDLSTSLLSAQDQIINLENELSSQSLIQTQLQQASHELEENVKDSFDRIEAQEQQIAEMQEQILHQAQQSREFETAVQHWKDRSEKYERFLGQLFTVLDDLPKHAQKLDPQQYAKLIEIRDQLF